MICQHCGKMIKDTKTCNCIGQEMLDRFRYLSKQRTRGTGIPLSPKKN